jgi:uncharacterized cupin superfamily protein
MFVYPVSQPTRQLPVQISANDLGARVLEGEPRFSAAVDFHEHGMTAGIFEATRGKLEVTFPFTEHGTVLEGEVTITDPAGLRHTYRPGDSFLIPQGQVVIWDVQAPRMRKSFLNIVVGNE